MGVYDSDVSDHHRQEHEVSTHDTLEVFSHLKSSLAPHQRQVWPHDHEPLTNCLNHRRRKQHDLLDLVPGQLCVSNRNSIPLSNDGLDE